MAALYADTLNRPRTDSGLEASLGTIEALVAALGAALREQNLEVIDIQATTLQRAMASAVHRFNQAARQPEGIERSLRQRLALAGAQIAAQREGLARATAGIDRAIDVLMPPAHAGSLYGQAGHNQRAASGGFLQA